MCFDNKLVKRAAERVNIETIPPKYMLNEIRLKKTILETKLEREKQHT